MIHKPYLGTAWYITIQVMFVNVIKFLNYNNLYVCSIYNFDIYTGNFLLKVHFNIQNNYKRKVLI